MRGPEAGDQHADISAAPVGISGLSAEDVRQQPGPLLTESQGPPFIAGLAQGKEDVGLQQPVWAVSEQVTQRWGRLGGQFEGGLLTKHPGLVYPKYTCTRPWVPPPPMGGRGLVSPVQSPPQSLITMPLNRVLGALSVDTFHSPTALWARAWTRLG